MKDGRLPLPPNSPYLRHSGHQSREAPDHMIARTTRRALTLTLAFATLATLARPVAAQAALSGVEQARRDSLRRPYTKADISFMSGMIAHHAQAVKMASWAKSHNASSSL